MYTTSTTEQLIITGRVLQLLPLQEGTSKAGNAWQKQDFILETPGQYPRKVCICLFGDNVVKFPLQAGQNVTVNLDIESREFNGRWYTDVRAWNVVYNAQQGVTVPAPTATAPTTQPAPTPANGATAQAPAGAPTAADDLPF